MAAKNQHIEANEEHHKNQAQSHNSLTQKKDLITCEAVDVWQPKQLKY